MLLERSWVWRERESRDARWHLSVWENHIADCSGAHLLSASKLPRDNNEQKKKTIRCSARVPETEQA